MIVTPVVSFPGRDRPGLIEAKGYIVAACDDPHRFRGVFAPASLKHRDGHRIAAQFVGFRGVIAPASLKHRDGHRIAAQFVGFRGVIAPASLKRQ